MGNFNGYHMSSSKEEPLSRRIPLEDILTATNNFSEKNLFEHGGKADDYKGFLLNSKEDVIVRKYKSTHTSFKFYEDVRTLSGFKHRNIVSLIGFCDEKDERLIVMEHVDDRDLDEYLSDPTLTGSKRLYLCFLAVDAMGYWKYKDHNGFSSKGFKILLDKDREPKVLICIDDSMSHKEKSLGVILLEVIYGRKVTTDDVNHFLTTMEEARYRREKLPIITESLLTFSPKAYHFLTSYYKEKLPIFSGITDTCLNSKSLFTFSLNAYQLLQWEHYHKFDRFYNILQGLKEAYILQREHENPGESDDILEGLEDAYWERHINMMQDVSFLVKIPLKDIRSTETFNRNIDSLGEVYDAKLNHFNFKTSKDEVTKTTDTVTIRSFFHITRQDFLSYGYFLTRCEHPNIVTPLGFCDEDNEMLLLYEHCPNGSLDAYLRRTDYKTNLTWAQRLKMCIDIAHGLNYLLTIRPKRIMRHCKIRSTNILLGKNWEAKITNFELHGYHHWNNLKSTIEKIVYLDPEDPRKNWFRQTSAIYSFGVVLFEIFSGKLAYDLTYIQEDVKGLAPIAQRQFLEGTLMKMLDPKLMDEASELCSAPNLSSDENSFDVFSKIANQCLAKDERERPTIQLVIKELNKALYYQGQERIKVQRLEQLKVPLKDIKLATNDFNKKFLIGSGGYAKVYRAELNLKSKHELSETSKMVAVKRIMSREYDQGSKGFLSEVDVLSRCEHPNIITLLGFCNEGNEMLQVYEYASEGSLSDCLESPDKRNSVTWASRLKICIDIAQGLNYLHNTMEDNKGIVHRDIKSDNILFGKNWQAKIADFGLCKFNLLNQQKSTIITNNVAGTKVYIDPEYSKTGRLKKASDIYSFGVVLFEIFTGTLAYASIYTSKNEMGLAPVARSHFKKGTLKEMLDPNVVADEVSELGSTVKLRPDQDSLDAFLEIAHQCIAETQANRPTIKVVIKELENALYIHENWTLKISVEQIKSGTDNFSDEKCIITGGYGKLYQGKLQYSNREKKVTVKRFDKHFSDTSFSWEKGFLKELEVLCKYKQENIIGLVGYCIENFEKVIVYEHAYMGSLNSYLNNTSFSWINRLKVCIGIAKGLKFLHGGDGRQDFVIHRDLKSSNILLTEDWKAKLCGFELALTYPANTEIEYVKNDVIGSPGYCDPLYLETGYNLITIESDIYSFGVILFEILCGRLACPKDFRDQSQFLDVLVKRHILEARLEEIVFEGIKEQIAPRSLFTFRRIGSQCLQEDLKERPTAADVLVQLQIALEFQEAYETRVGTELQIEYEKLQQLSKFPERYSEMAKKFIYDILTNKILLENDKLEILRAFGQTTGDLKQLEDDNT